MATQQRAALVGFAFVSSITPGPNNMMLTASGANFGKRRTPPHMLGVTVGFSIMIALVGVGVGVGVSVSVSVGVGVGLVGLSDAWPPAFMIPKGVSAVYLLWLAWKSATSPPRSSDTDKKAPRPMNFTQAALFLWVNPKAWTIALTAITVYTGTRTIAAVLCVAAVFGLINLPAISSGAAMGQHMRRWMINDAKRRTFNWGMAALLMLSLVVAL